MAIAQDIAAIRGAAYGKDVREAIAHGIEQCYTDVTNSSTLANTAANSANSAASSANSAASDANQAAQSVDDKVDEIVLVQNTQPTSERNKIWVKPESDEYEVPTWEEFQELSAKVDELNIPADYTELSDDVTGLKSAVDIVAESEKETYHSENTIGSIDVFGNELAFSNVSFADRENIFPKFSNQSGTLNGIDYIINGRFFVLDGTSSSGSMIRTTPNKMDINIEETTEYKLIIQQNGRFTASDNPCFILNGFDANGTEYQLKNKQFNNNNYYLNNSSQRVWTLDIQDIIKKINITFLTPSGNSYDNVTFWICLCKSDVSIVDKGSTVAPGQKVTYEIESGFTNGLDSMQHESIAEYHPTVQEYIDNKTIDINESLTYVTPEAFGAKGDNQTDDSEAFSLCIAYANEHGKSVRALQKYAVSETIEVTYSYLDVYINYVTYLGSDTAIKLKGRNNKIHVGFIFSNTNGASGFRMIADSNPQTRFNDIDIGYIYANGNAFEVLNGTNDPERSQGFYAIYNSIRFEHLQSTNGNGILIESTYGEKIFYGGDISVVSGWSIMNYDSTCTFINICMESTHGIYMRGLDNAGNSFIGGRNRELCDKYGKDQTDPYLGVLFKFDTVGHDNVYFARDAIKAQCIDISDQDKTILSDKTWENENRLRVICPGASANEINYYSGDGDEILLRLERVVIKGTPERAYTVTTSTMDMRGYPCNYRLCTRFIAGANSTIYLNESYCSVGLSTFQIEQTSSYKLIIYDCRGTLVFDGTNESEGVYEITAYFDLANNSGNNDAEHDSWSVRKL